MVATQKYAYSFSYDSHITHKSLASCYWNSKISWAYFSSSSGDSDKATVCVIPSALAVSAISKLGALSSVLVSSMTTFQVLC